MNKQELKEKVKSLESFNPCTGTDFEWGFDVCRHEVLSLIQALDEPQKVKVPAFVAEWFEINKEQLEVAIWDLTTETYETDRDQLSEIQLWIKESDRPYKTLISMQDGYEVEEEPKYRIEFPVSYGYRFLSKNISGQTAFTSAAGKYTNEFTESEIKAIDERYWPFAVPVEKV